MWETIKRWESLFEVGTYLRAAFIGKLEVTKNYYFNSINIVWFWLYQGCSAYLRAGFINFFLINAAYIIWGKHLIVGCTYLSKYHIQTTILTLPPPPFSELHTFAVSSSQKLTDCYSFHTHRSIIFLGHFKSEEKTDCGEICPEWWFTMEKRLVYICCWILHESPVN